MVLTIFKVCNVINCEFNKYHIINYACMLSFYSLLRRLCYVEDNGIHFLMKLKLPIHSLEIISSLFCLVREHSVIT